MNKKLLRIFFVFACITLPILQLHATSDKDNTFTIDQPDLKQSPYTGMTRKHWIDAGRYLLNGAFGYVHSLDDPMIFPKQPGVSYPRREDQVPTEKLEGLCRTLFIAAPLLKENPELELNGIKVGDYYRHQLLKLIDPKSDTYIKHRAPNGGPHQNLVEFGALSISLFTIPDILWNPLTKEQKDELAATMLSYGDGPTVPSNWKFFNIFVLSFFKAQGYTVNEKLLVEYLDKSLEHYRGDGWYNDNPAFDYYSMWAFQMYGPVWSHVFGEKYYPEYAKKFEANFRDMASNYPYMFNEDGKMIMWGRSIAYRFGSIVPFPLTGFLNDPNINYGWLRRIASSTLLQFLQHPDFLKDNVPTLGFYGAFEPAVQGYSCRGSAYWCGKAFLGLLLPADNIFWTATEDKGPWGIELTKGNVYNKFQSGSDILITDYPNSGASEIRAWCNVPYIPAWEKFRASENYNKLAYNSEFPWMADSLANGVSMNYATKNKDNVWEVLRMYTFSKYENGIYYRNAVLETNQDIKYHLADIPLPNGILRVDKISSPVSTDIRLGHYSLPQLENPTKEQVFDIKGNKAYIINNGKYSQAMISLSGWSGLEFIKGEGVHPESDYCTVINSTDRLPKGDKIYITLQIWKKGNKDFTKEELSPVKEFKISAEKKTVSIILNNGSIKEINFQ